VSAEDRHRNKQKAERNRPSSDHVGPWTDPLRDGKPWTPARVARLWRRSLNQHQTPAGTDFTLAATHHGSRAPADGGGRAPLSIPAALDPLAHILDFGPPSTGLGSSWHRRRS
jgi:hypothetical protein